MADHRVSLSKARRLIGHREAFVECRDIYLQFVRGHGTGHHLAEAVPVEGKVADTRKRAYQQDIAQTQGWRAKVSN